MNNTSELKSRIKSINTIRKITKAMKLVATAKLQKNRKVLARKNEYFEITREIVNYFLNNSNNNMNLFTKIYEENIKSKAKLYIVINSEMGFCGAFNSNLNKLVFSNYNPLHDKVFVFGKKALSFFNNNKIKIIKNYKALSDNLFMDELIIPNSEIYREFNNNKYCEIGIYYNHFINSLKIEPRYLKLWPSSKDNKDILKTAKEIKSDLDKYSAKIEFEPNPESVAFEVFPKYLSIIIYSCCIMSKVSENSLRRVTMENATDNAGDIINDLTYKYNIERQSSITQEIAEIVSGAQR